LIDVIISNSLHVSFCDVIYSGLSDHDIVVIVRKWNGNKTKGIGNILKTRSFKNFNEKTFCDDLRRANWDEVTNAVNIDIACENFIEIVNTITDRHAPKVAHRVSNRTPGWITDDLRNAIKERELVKKSS